MLVASDAVVIAPRMDGVLFVVAAGSTSRRVSRNALEALQRTGSHVLGAVLNMQARPQQENYYYYDYQSKSTTGPVERSPRPKQLGQPVLSGLNKSKEL